MTYSLQRKFLTKGATLFKEGDPANSLFIIIHGEVEVSKSKVYFPELGCNIGDIYKNPLKARK